MSKLVFATGNPNKVREVNELLRNTPFEPLSMHEMGHFDDLPETQETLEGNAAQKVRALYGILKLDCFSEDTGLEVDALGGAPGVYTARFGGPAKSADANMERLLSELKDKDDRRAQFRTVIALLLNGELHLFEGICRGMIRHQKSGTDGFGYDPIFQPDGYSITFAEMESTTKNEISHRGKAIQKLVAFLENGVA